MELNCAAAFARKARKTCAGLSAMFYSQ
jgi:hypothetical protein